MGWIAVVGDGQRWVDPSLSARRMTGIDRAMRRGTILIEADAPTLATGPALIRLTRSGGAQGMMSLQWVPARGLVLLVTQGAQVFHATLPFDMPADRLCLSFAWDLDRATARLAAEMPQQGRVSYLTVDNPLPVFLSDFWSLTRSKGGVELGSGVRFIAVSEAVEPLGPLPTLGAGTLIDAPEGPRAISALVPGDTVRTLSGEAVPVLQVVSHSLPAAGSFRPMSLAQHTLGSTAPLIAAPIQRLVITGPDVADAYGAKGVRLAARNLPRGNARPLSPESAGPLVTYYQLVLPGAEPVMAQGLALETLNLGDLWHDRVRASHSLMAALPRNLLPEHQPSPYPVLDASETQSLAAARAA